MYEIFQFIKEVGFPIVAFVLVFWQSNTSIKNNTKAIKENCEITKDLKIWLINNGK